MDPILTIAFILLILMAIHRIRRAFRNARNDRQAEIQRKLSELRKKRDEE